MTKRLLRTPDAQALSLRWLQLDTAELELSQATSKCKVCGCVCAPRWPRISICICMFSVPVEQAIILLLA